MTRLDDFDYELPEQLIAQYPCERRDGSRLLVVDRSSNSLTDRHFYDLPEYLHAGDLLVLNSSRVVPTRLFGKKAGGGANIELLLLNPCDPFAKAAAGTGGAENGGAVAAIGGSLPASGDSRCWQALARPARRLKPGDIIVFDEGLQAVLLSKQDDGTVTVSLQHQGGLLELLQRIGHMPLPPYIHRQDEPSDTQRYQTVYARLPGSVAAPTAGLHFTEALLGQLRDRGVQLVEVTLHVGLGTFKPVQSDRIEEHRMHQELYHIDTDAADAINSAKAAGQRVVCVGTTAVRTLESACLPDGQGRMAVRPGWGSTDIFIYPGGRSFRLTDALITNFHLPKSTLLMLVAAFYNTEGVLAAYAHAVQSNYRFFSYGDAMLIA